MAGLLRSEAILRWEVCPLLLLLANLKEMNDGTYLLVLTIGPLANTPERSKKGSPLLR
jgi:hypothetical protein